MGLRRVELLEILDLAMSLESCGESCYRTAAECLGPGPVRDMLESLAEQESAHAGKFEEFLGESVAEEMFRDPESEVVARFAQRVPLSDLLKSDLQELGGRLEFLIGQKEAVLESLESAERVADLIEFALFLEQTAVLLYEALLKYVSGPVAKAWLRSVLNEEKHHLQSFERLKAQLGSSQVA